MSARPRYSNEELRAIFLEANGECHLCRGKHGPLVFSRYGDVAHQGGWEVEHVRCVKKGGTHSRGNLLPAHIGTCNRARGIKPAQAFRREKGTSGRPLSAADVRSQNRFGVGFSATGGAIAGAAVGGPVGALIGGAIGAMFGDAHADRVVTARGSARGWRERNT